MTIDNLRLSLKCLFSISLICSTFLTGKVESVGASTDRNALLSFKLKVSDPRNVLGTWTQNTSHCSWYGVNCSIKGGRVRSLNLSGAGLFGTLPQQLSNLSSLYLLDLANNSFHGPIPSEFGLLSNLQYLTLSMNSFTDTIPAFLSQCYKMKSIRLVHNMLVGNIPSELGYLSSLEKLDFSYNNLTGFIPSTFGNLTYLTMLGLKRNKLVGEIPRELGRLRRLRWIQLSENGLVGEIPSSIFNISSLDFVSLTDNNLTGKLPDDLDHTLPNLQTLLLAQNSLEGLIPTSLNNASNIQSLDISFNRFHGPIPLFGNMKGLVYLAVGSNYLTSNTNLNFQLIDSLRNCTNLEVLKVFSNNLSGLFPSSVANMSTHLQHFCISNNFLYGTFPKGMENFHDLLSLSIEENYFSGKVPQTIGNLNKLQNLWLFGNRFSGEFPNVFGNFSQLANIMIGNNQFSGRIPATIEACKQLTMLDLGENKFAGSVPAEIFALSTLVWLRLKRNSLTGPLPDGVGNLKQLQVFDVSGNHLSGSVTSLLGNCFSLQSLNLSGNNFTGPIPDTLGKLASLQELDLSSNTLTGLIPDVLVKLQDLKILNLSFNELKGTVPSNGGVFLNLSSVYLRGNYRLCHNNRTAAEVLGLFQCTTSKRGANFWVKIIVLVAVIILVVIILLCIGYALMSGKEQKAERDKIPTSLPGLPPKISYADIKLATDNFAMENLLGKGGFGAVYKGLFSNDENGSRGTILAVKVLDLNQSKAVRSFDSECKALRNVRHRNLVKLVTSCSSVEHSGVEFKALIMEFMPRGSLEEWLYQKGAMIGLSLTLLQRLNIIIDVASAMDYLHHDCIPPIVHRDLKPGNVLLDDSMVAHVSDFGLASILSHDSCNRNESSTIGLKGSVGYIPPEYGVGGNASIPGDVYSFGILLLETFIAKKPTDGMFKEGLSLNKFASAVDENHVAEIADPLLFVDVNEAASTRSTSSSGFINDGNSTDSNGNYNRFWTSKFEKCLSSVIRVGLSCTTHSATERITMREALLKLQEIKKNFQQI